MSIKVKGGMYCPACKKPVMAQRSGHAVRNTVGAAATLGLALKSERWRCPSCGGIAYSKATAPATAGEAGRKEWGVYIGMFVGIMLGFATQSIVVGFIALFVFGIVGAMIAVGAPTGRHAGQYRCEKNDHLLTAKHSACPIDGSPVRRI